MVHPDPAVAAEDQVDLVDAGEVVPHAADQGWGDYDKHPIFEFPELAGSGLESHGLAVLSKTLNFCLYIRYTK